MSADLHLTVGERLLAAGQRYTLARRALIDVLAAADRPLAMPDIVSRERLAHSSVYRNLAVLEREGIVRRVMTHGEHARYELAEELSEHHHHLICSTCGRVEDFVTPPRVERAVERAVGEAARRSGFDPRSHRIDLVGLCRDCS